MDLWLEDVEESLPPPVVAQARLLAAEVDADPDNSPLHGRLTTTLSELVGRVRASEDEQTRGVFWELQTGCQIEAHLRGPIHCGKCCADRAGRGAADLERWVPPARWEIEGRAGGVPVREVSDEEYARFAVQQFLAGA